MFREVFCYAVFYHAVGSKTISKTSQKDADSQDNLLASKHIKQNLGQNLGSQGLILNGFLKDCWVHHILLLGVKIA